MNLSITPTTSRVIPALFWHCNSIGILRWRLAGPNEISRYKFPSLLAIVAVAAGTGDVFFAYTLDVDWPTPVRALDTGARLAIAPGGLSQRHSSQRHPLGLASVSATTHGHFGQLLPQS
jgi:hypothetical protein